MKNYSKKYFYNKLIFLLYIRVKPINAFYEIERYPVEDQVTARMHSVTNFETQKKEFRLLMDDYPPGDLDKIFEYTVHPVENNPVFIEEFYRKRNAEWMPKLDKMMHENLLSSP